jgi:hypothetical protein
MTYERNQEFDEHTLSVIGFGFGWADMFLCRVSSLFDHWPCST